jgi:phosphoribosylformylglycinamidine cyclo-ligase
MPQPPSDRPDSPSPDRGLTYREAGVDIDAKMGAIGRIRDKVRSTYSSQVLTEIGSFGGLFQVPAGDHSKMVLVGSVDGVGTKLKVAFLTGRHDTCGYDLVSHCVNDILVMGARPLFFMDYLALGRVESGVVEQVMDGFVRACLEAGCALIGGETAEMPDFYQPGEYDMAGFIVGTVQRDRILDGKRVQVGDHLLALPSVGLHTNGYSLARKIVFERQGLSPDDVIPELGMTAADALLAPHRQYLAALDRPLEAGWLRALAHITGGGLTDNLPRVLPAGVAAEIRRGAWDVPPLFRYLQEVGGIAEDEMFRVFNQGVGMVMVVGPDDADALRGHLESIGEAPFEVGRIVPGDREVIYR